MLTHRFDDAVAHASALHRRQTRKGSGIPYIAHLMAVSALVFEYRGDEDQAIAGLLHDAIEDQGGMAAHSEIARRYGARVASIVLECSDNNGEEKAAWQQRKGAYLAGIAAKSDDAVLVTACDKLHNATAILHDLISTGDALWPRFTAGRNRTLWYYRALADALCSRLPGPLTDKASRRKSATLLLAGRSTRFERSTRSAFI